MIDISELTFFAAFRPCGCLSTCVRTDVEDANAIQQAWQAKGLIVREMTGRELVSMKWACPIYRAKQHRLETYELANRGGE